MDTKTKYSLTVTDRNSRNALLPSQWLDVGRDSFATLETPHTVSLSRNDSKIAEGSVSLTEEGDAKACVTIHRIATDVSTEESASLLYFLLREARIAQCADFEITEDAQLPILHAIGAQPDLCRNIGYATHIISKALDPTLNAFVRDSFPTEVERTIEHHIAMFLKEEWPVALCNATITRRQYIRFLFNLHGYVRMTTRLLGHCVGCSHDTELRSHYIHHLNGEVNHEKLIESDLAGLGVDVTYLVDEYVPIVSTQQFLATQQSTAGFLADPVLFLACPIAAESFAAYAKKDILCGLQKSLSNWFSDDAQRITHFVTSHTLLDGGDNGHWIKCIRLLSDYVRDETCTQRFLGILNSSMVSLRSMFNSNL